MHLYFHIPFCRQACHYCDFHFSTNLKAKKEVLKAILIEIGHKKAYLAHKEIETIYFGGGTPSLLSAEELSMLFEEIRLHFSIKPHAEITLEANPEDLTKHYLKDIHSLGINRLSIGIQSFSEKNLPFLNRNHSIEQSKQSITWAREEGFQKLSLDYIFGIPGTTLNDVKSELNAFIASGATHLSTYSLTIEPKTYFGVKHKKGLFKETPEPEMANQFAYLIDYLTANGFEQYEISNFAKNGDISEHNSSYWKQEEYAGIGPSAHSFNGKSRQWNVSSNGKYVQAIQSDKPYFEIEQLSGLDFLNEFIMTRLRTSEGIPLATFRLLTDQNSVALPNELLEEWINKNLAFERQGHLILSKSGKLFADKLSSDLFYV